MSEFKFACPVCGQHITADSSTSGGQLECPTCFQKIVIPQAPASADSKFILSASQVGKPRPVGAPIESNEMGPRRSSPLPVAAALLVVLCAAGAAAYVFRAKLFKAGSDQTQAPTNQSPTQKIAAAQKTAYPIPSDLSWSLDCTNAAIPNENAVGKINGDGFFCEKAVLQGVLAREAGAPPRCDLTLRQGRGGSADLGVTVQLFASAGEDLSGKTVQVAPDRPPPVPKVVLRWKDDQQKAVTRNFSSGYALKLIFGEAANSRIPGKIFIGLPDDAKSFVAGTFEAEIRKPSAPKPKPPKIPKPPKTAG
jgi:hypothetical protein